MENKTKHPLSVWAKKNGVKLYHLAAQVDIGPNTLSMYLNGKASPPKVTRLAFELVTGGAVKADQWGTK